MEELPALLIATITAAVQAYQDAQAKDAAAQAQVAAKLQAAFQLLGDAQAQTTSDMAARDAATLARLAAHPGVPQPVAAVLDEMAKRWAAPLPAPVAMVGDKPLT